jgi:Hint module
MVATGNTRKLLGSQVAVTFKVQVSGSKTANNFVMLALKSANTQTQIITSLSACNQGYAVSSVSDATVTAVTAAPSMATAAPSMATAAPSMATAAPFMAPVAAPTYTTSSCFAASETVQLESGDTKFVADVRIGDRVLAADSTGKLVFSPVVYLPHGANKDIATFSQISTRNGHDVKMTINHVIFAGACGSILPLVYASEVTVGDCIDTVSGQDVVVSVDAVQSEGVYTVITKEEFIVVNGIIASPFGANHMMANMYYNIHRFLFSLSPLLLSCPLLQSANEKMGIVIPLFGPSAAAAPLLRPSPLN